MVAVAAPQKLKGFRATTGARAESTTLHASGELGAVGEQPVYSSRELSSLEINVQRPISEVENRRN